jgi:peroxiredoxin
MRHLPTLALWSVFLCIPCLTTVCVTAQDADAAKDKAESPAAPDEAAAVVEGEPATPEGHSVHGEVFNEGPRQAAWLMEGVGHIHFPVTIANDEAKQFFEQGVAQLHGFWYFESERSFRQTAELDPECAMAYWGMAMSNRSNKERAKGFIKEAMDRKDKASRREQLYIEAFDRYINARSDNAEMKRKRAERYITDLDNLIQEFSDDIEAKAFLCEFFWSARRDGVKITSYVAIDAMIEDILEVEPLHSVHHYRIHLWDTKKPENALRSAALCGPSAPAIAHMWHMPGHIYSRLKRYHDAVYQQEASARVDHAHMMQDRVIPDQIHNFAHNNEWCIRNLISIGRVHDAVALSQNMMSMPRHPKYNHLDKFGSFKYGRQRLLQVLKTYGMHEQLLVLSQTQWLQPLGRETEDLALERAVGAAYASLGKTAEAGEVRARLNDKLTAKKKEQTKSGDDAEAKAKKDKKDEKAVAAARKSAEEKHRKIVKSLDQAVKEIDGRLAVTRGEFEEALKLLKEAGGVPVEFQVSLMTAAGKHDDAIKKIADHVRTNRNEVLPLATQVVTLWKADKKDDARKALETLRKISETIDIDIPAFAAVSPVAVEMGFDRDWRVPLETADDLAARPELDALGPFRWQPVSAPDWTLAGIDNQPVTLSQFRGKPVVLIFYLGFGCLHCAEQLQAFEPKIAEFHKAGYEVVAISTDKQKDLQRAWENLDKPFSFPLVSDSELAIFREYRCFDDFEDQPLHGTFVIDAGGRIRWQDISYEPFMDPDYVLKEANRLLSLDGAITPQEPLQTVQATSGD